MSRYAFIEDPGHGWLEVTRAELRSLGIEKNISRYSYVRNGMAYLEEDCDAGVFLLAKKERGELVTLDERYEDPTPIRNYQPYPEAESYMAAPWRKAAA